LRYCATAAEPIIELAHKQPNRNPLSGVVRPIRAIVLGVKKVFENKLGV